MENAVIPLSAGVCIHDLDRSLCHTPRSPIPPPVGTNGFKLRLSEKSSLSRKTSTADWVISLMDSLKRLTKPQRRP